MIKIVAIVLQIVFVVGGVVLGMQLKSAGGEAAHDAAVNDSDSGHGRDDGDHKKSDKSKKDKKKKDKKKKSKGKKDSHGESDDHEDADTSDSGFLKFGRQFIVPVVSGSGVNSLVILDINLELPAGTTEKAYSREPKLRDALLSALLVLSNEGAFNERMLEQENVDHIRERLLAAAQTILDEDVNQVLILSMAKQNLDG